MNDQPIIIGERDHRGHSLPFGLSAADARQHLASLRIAGIEAALITVPAGEASKSLDTAEAVLSDMARDGVVPDAAVAVATLQSVAAGGQG